MSVACRCLLLSVFWAALPVLTVRPAQAQFFASCATASRFELERTLFAYQEHNFRLSYKFLVGYYLQGELPEELEHVTLDEIRRSLAADDARRSALLFHAYSGNAVCS